MKRLLLCRGGMYFPDESCMKQNFFMLSIFKSQRQNKGRAWGQAGIQRQGTMWLLRQLEGDMIFCGGSPGWAALNLPLAVTTRKKGRREKSLIVFLHFLLTCIRTKKIQFFVYQDIYLGKSLPQHVTAANYLYKFQRSLDKHLEEGSIAGKEKGSCWSDKPHQAQEIHSAENVWKLCEC